MRSRFLRRLNVVGHAYQSQDHVEQRQGWIVSKVNGASDSQTRREQPAPLQHVATSINQQKTTMSRQNKAISGTRKPIIPYWIPANPQTPSQLSKLAGA